MTRLLISVRSLDEFRTAVDAGADVIDIKEPTRGSLGRAELSTIDQIASAASDSTILSVALGELTEADEAICSLLPRRIDYVKFGLAGCSKAARWREAWRAQLTHLHRRTRAVAVAYADARQAQSPKIEEVISIGVEVGCYAFLIDTYRKDTGNLLAHLSVRDVTSHVARARDAGLLVALAGSLSANEIDVLGRLEPDLLAFRSAACRGRRTSNIDSAAIRTLADALAVRKDHNESIQRAVRVSHL